MKKAAAIIITLAISANIFAFFTFAADPKYIYNDGFNAAESATEFEKKYSINGAVCKVVTSEKHEGLGSLEVVKKKEEGAWWGGPRIYITRDKFKFDQDYAISFWIKLKDDIDVITLQVLYNGNKSLNAFMTMNIAGWTHMSGVINLKKLMEDNGQDFTDIPEIVNGNLTNAWSFAFVSAAGNYSTIYLDELMIVEGDKIPGINVNDNDTYRTLHPDTQQTPPSSTVVSTPKPTSSSSTPASVASNTTAEVSNDDDGALGTDDQSGDVSSAENESELSAGTSSKASTGTNGKTDEEPKFPLTAIIIIAIAVLACGGAAVYILVIKKKNGATEPPAENADE